MPDPHQLGGEADQIALHVIGRRAGDRERALYARAVGALGAGPTPAEASLWGYMVRSRRGMAWGDAGLALLRPSSILRQRILVMVAILEASPEHAGKFLPRRYSALESAAVGAAALRGAFRAVAGIAVVKYFGA